MAENENNKAAKPENIEWNDIEENPYFPYDFDGMFTAKYPYYKCEYTYFCPGQDDETWVYCFMSYDETELLVFLMHKFHLGKGTCLSRKSIECDSPIDKKALYYYTKWILSPYEKTEPVIERDGTIKNTDDYDSLDVENRDVRNNFDYIFGIMTDAWFNGTGDPQLRYYLANDFYLLKDSSGEYIIEKDCRKHGEKATYTVQCVTPYIVASDKKGLVECIAESPAEEPELMSSESINLLFILFAEHLAKKTGTVEAKRKLSTDYIQLGNTLKARNRPANARDYYLKSLKILQQLAKETRTAKSYDDLAVICYKLGSVYQTNPNIELLKKARDIFRMLAENCPGVKRYTDCLRIVEDTLAKHQ